MKPRHSSLVLAAILSAGVLAAGRAAAVVPTIPARNIEVLANRNDYPPGGGMPYGAGYAACWSYVHEDGREYAVIGTSNGTAIYNVVDPADPYLVGFIPGLVSLWREMKSYRDCIYVVTESATGPYTPGMQIIRMTDPENPVLWGTYTTNFQLAHTVSVDTTRALLIANGTRQLDGMGGASARGTRIMSIAVPHAPVELGWWPGGALPVSTTNYVHDSVPIGNRLYAASIYVGTPRVIDITNPATPTQIASWTYPGGYYTHNVWPDPTETYLYVTDEQNGQTLRVFDISSLSAPPLVSQYTPNPQAIVHNVVMRNNELFVANYTEGVRVMDLSDPAHPAEYGWADTYPGTSGSYYGVWGICPEFPSGTVIASDMQTGLWVFRPVRDYGILQVRVIDASTGQSAPEVIVNLPSQGDSSRTGADGVVRFAPSPGLHTVALQRFGYRPSSASVNVSDGGVDSVTLTLEEQPIGELSGTVINAQTAAPLVSAEVSLRYTPMRAVTAGDGTFELLDVPDDGYLVEARRAGFAPEVRARHVGPSVTSSLDFELEPALSWDDLEAVSGWTVGGAGTGDNATGGVWQRGDPLGTGAAATREACPCGCGDMGGSTTTAAHAHGHTESASGSCCAHTESQRPTMCLLGSCGTGTHASSGCIGAPRSDSEGRVGAIVEPQTRRSRSGPAAPEGEEGRTGAAPPGTVQPEVDHTPAPGVNCFFTGQGGMPDVPEDGDVDAGTTTLTSPAFAVAAVVDPVIGYWRWFYTNGDENDWLAVSISNDDGANWTAVDTTRGRHNAWEERAIRVQDYVTATNQVKVRFAAADLGPASIVEGAIDDIVVYPYANSPVGVDPVTAVPGRLAFRAPQPNPSSGEVRFALDLPRAGVVDVEVLDLGGRRVLTLHRGHAPAGPLALRWNGRDEAGRTVPAGLYYVRARAGGESASVRIARLR